jgi:hypothetical protein
MKTSALHHLPGSARQPRGSLRTRTMSRDKGGTPWNRKTRRGRRRVVVVVVGPGPGARPPQPP